MKELQINFFKIAKHLTYTISFLNKILKKRIEKITNINSIQTTRKRKLN